MTLEELKETIDTYIGLKSEVVKRYHADHNARLVYISSTGVTLFELTVGDYGQGWQFGGSGGALPEEWQTLCMLHKSQ